jgi:hypothetical protein
VNPELNTLLTTLYVLLTDRVLPDLGVSRDRRPGRKPGLSDAELLCLAVAQQLLGYSSEPRWIRYARTHLTGMFPGIPQQSGYNKRLRAAGTLISATITALAKDTRPGMTYFDWSIRPRCLRHVTGDRQAILPGMPATAIARRTRVFLGLPPVPDQYL